MYEAKTTLLVQQRRAGNEAGVSDFNLSQQLAKTFGRQVESTPFLERVSSKSDVSLSLGKLQKMVSSSTDRQPPTVDVKVQHTDPRFAYETANMLGAEFIEYVLELRLTEIAKLQAAAASLCKIYVGCRANAVKINKMLPDRSQKLTKSGKIKLKCIKNS